MTRATAYARPPTLPMASSFTMPKHITSECTSCLKPELEQMLKTYIDDYVDVTVMEPAEKLSNEVTKALEAITNRIAQLEATIAGMQVTIDTLKTLPKTTITTISPFPRRKTPTRK